MLLAEKERMLQGIVDEFDSRQGRKLEVNAGKSKTTASERARKQS